MAVKSILCILSGTPNELNALNTAFVIGSTYGAEIRFLHISPDPTDFIGIYYEGIMVDTGITATIEKENKVRLEKTKQYVTSFAAKYRIPLDQSDLPAHHAYAKFLHLTGSLSKIIPNEGRFSDLIILSRVDEIDHESITSAIFNTGRPVLIMPPTQNGLFKEWQDKTVVFAWNDSFQASHALYNALPLLKRTEKFYILTVEKYGQMHDPHSESVLLNYLRAQGLTAEIIRVNKENHISTGDALLVNAKKLSAGFLILGAYGHSVVREMILGGVTEYFLKNSDLPLLLSH